MHKPHQLYHTMIPWDVEVIPGVSIVILPNLQKLDITFTVNGLGEFSYLFPSPFFQRLNLPALKDLTVDVSNCDR
jgi:hypothetical protein